MTDCEDLLKKWVLTGGIFECQKDTKMSVFTSSIPTQTKCVLESPQQFDFFFYRTHFHEFIQHLTHTHIHSKQKFLKKTQNKTSKFRVEIPTTSFIDPDEIIVYEYDD